MNIKLLGEELYDGETRRGDCPSCGRPKTFTVTKKDGGVVWNCYSSHCGYRGAMGSNRTNLVRTRIDQRKQKTHPFTGELKELTVEQREELLHRVGFAERHCDTSGVRYAPVEDRYAYPIFAPTGRRRGWVLRRYGGDPRWKTLTRLEVEEPHLSWYRGTEHSNKVLVVEDIPSAVRASTLWPGWAVAMVGGGIGPDYVREITAYAKNVVWAFDPDATAGAVRHHRNYGLCFESSTVLPLAKDLKDQTDAQIQEVLKCVL